MSGSKAMAAGTTGRNFWTASGTSAPPKRSSTARYWTCTPPAWTMTRAQRSPAAHWKCPAYPGSRNRTPKTIASVAYGFCAAPSLLLPRPDGGIGRTDIARWTAGIHGGSHIWSKHTRSASAAMPDTPGTVSRWSIASESSQVAGTFSLP